MTVELVLDVRNIVGESIIWSVSEQALYWVDIVGGAIHRLDPQSGGHTSWETPELPTSIGLRGRGGFIVGLRRRVVLWYPGGPFETFAVPEPDLPRNRLNEGVVAPDGAFWVGTMQDNIAADGSPQPITAHCGAIYRIAPDGAVTRLTGADFGITNTMVWTDDFGFITADTLRNALYRYDYDDGLQTLTNRQPFGPELRLGLPDGSTRDAAGKVYNARVAGGAAIALLGADGTPEASIAMPCSSPTSCTFGGADFRTLYVTSARFGMGDAELAKTPQEGGLWSIRMAGAGRPSFEFAG